MSSRKKQLSRQRDIMSAFRPSFPTRRQAKSFSKKPQGRSLVTLERDFNRPKH
jgi:hypothetical protein